MTLKYLHIYLNIEDTKIVDTGESKILMDVDGNEVATFTRDIHDDTIIQVVRLMNKVYRIGHECGVSHNQRQILKALGVGWIHGTDGKDHDHG